MKGLEKVKGMRLRVQCPSYNALLTRRGCKTNIHLAKNAARKWGKGVAWDAITDQEWERWLVCSACPRAGMENRHAKKAWRHVAREAFEVLTTVYADDGRTGRKGPHRKGAWATADVEEDVVDSYWEEGVGDGEQENSARA